MGLQRLFQATVTQSSTQQATLSRCAQRNYHISLVPGAADTRVKMDPSPRLTKDVENHCDVQMNTHPVPHMHTRTYTCTYITYKLTDTFTFTLRHILIHTCAYSHVHTHIHSCTHVHTCTHNAHTCIHTLTIMSSVIRTL